MTIVLGEVVFLEAAFPQQTGVLAQDPLTPHERDVSFYVALAIGDEDRPACETARDAEHLLVETRLTDTAKSGERHTQVVYPTPRKPLKDPSAHDLLGGPLDHEVDVMGPKIVTAKLGL